MHASASGSVMIVDDDYDIRSSLEEILQDEGYDVSTATDGADALRQLRQLREGDLPDLILLDLMMPIMDGFAFCEHWHSDPTIASVPVVVISADASVKQKAAGCAASGFLAKPLDLVQLLRTVERYARS